MSDLKHLARRIFHDALTAIRIPDAMRDRLEPSGSAISIAGEALDLASYRRICAVSIGKAAPAMARGLLDLLPDALPFEGILVAPHDAVCDLPGFRSMAAGHPLPDAGSLTAARAILDLLSHCDAETLVFFLLSGGGSALVESPLNAEISLADLRQLNRSLVGCGAPIDEINAVRKHLSAVKGGRLAAAAPASMKVSLGVSDVPRGRESALASGPTLPDPTTVAEACGVVARYGLAQRLPATIAAAFADPACIPETPKPGDPIFARARFDIVLDSTDLFHHAHRAAEAHGCVSVCDNSADDWPLADAAGYWLAQLADLARANPGRRVALIAGGEVRSPVVGDGIGGRNSAFVLDCVERIAAEKATGKHIAVLSAGTDGKDGSSPAAGAAADEDTLERARAANLDPRDFARRSDSYNFFRKLGDDVETGPTGNNLRDLRIFVAE